MPRKERKPAYSQTVNAEQQVIDHYKRIRNEFPAYWWDMLDDAERRTREGNVEIDGDFFFLLFNKPIISQQFQLAVLRTNFSFLEAVKKQDPVLVREEAFFVYHKGGEIIPTMVVNRPAAYDRPMSEIETKEDEERQAAVFIHTHPPFANHVLSPSVILDNENIGYKGDLYSFLAIRKANEEDKAQDKKPSFIRRPLSILLQTDLERLTVKMLLIRESERLADTDRQLYIDLLKQFGGAIKRCQTEEEVCKYLQQIGYQASYLEFALGKYNSYPFISPPEVAKIVKDISDGT